MKRAFLMLTLCLLIWTPAIRATYAEPPARVWCQRHQRWHNKNHKCKDEDVSTIETIGSVGCDFATPQAWMNSHTGQDLTIDPNAPYIGEMEPEEFPDGCSFRSDITCDATHYLHLRPKSGYEFKGDFDAPAGSFPRLGVTPITSGTFLSTDFARLEGFVFDGSLSNPIEYSFAEGVVQIDANNVLLDKIGVIGVSAVRNDPFGGKTFGAILVRTNRTGAVIRNVSISGVTYENTNTGSFGGASTGVGIYVQSGTEVSIFNCAMNRICGYRYSGYQEVAYGILASGATAKIINNAIGELIAGTTTQAIVIQTPVSSDLQYNATTDTSGGTNSQDNITPANEFKDATAETPDLHMKAGGQCDGNGLNLIESSYPDAPTEDCDGETRPTTGAWSIGIDYHVAPLIPKIGWTLDANLPDWTLDQNHPDWTPDANLADWTLDPNPVEWTPRESLPEWTLDKE